VADGPWYDLSSCWFNGFYTRTLPSHSSEMTAAHLHQNVVNTLAAHRNPRITLPQKQKLAAVIHLCGLKRGEAFVTRGFRVTPGERCGTHNLQQYLTKIELMRKRFARLRKNNRFVSRCERGPRKVVGAGLKPAPTGCFEMNLAVVSARMFCRAAYAASADLFLEI
jgi:hypothetical protein